MKIIFYPDGLTNVPPAAMTALNVAAQFFDHVFKDNITVNIDVGWGEVGGVSYGNNTNNLVNGTTGGKEGVVQSQYVNVTYGQLLSVLQSHEQSADDIAAVNNLLATADPTGGGTIRVELAEARALGLFESGPDNFLDAWIGFNPSPMGLPWDFDPNNRTAFGSEDFIGMAEHEISHALGRVAGLGRPFAFDNSFLNGYTPLDLFRYSAPGQHDLAGFPSDYFSFNNGSRFSAHPLPVDGSGHPIYQFQANVAGNDPGDWTNFDSFGYYDNTGGNGGIGNFVSETDLREMDVLGFARSAAPKGDLTGDGTSDIMWRNGATGNTILWSMQGPNAESTGFVGGDTTWSVVGTGDFNGDFTADLLWRNASTGLTIMWTMDGPQVLGNAAIGGDLNWTVCGTGDFNGDGNCDILWRNNSTGTVLMWQMNGSQAISKSAIGGDTTWSVVGTGDFNGDGKSDILWRNATNGNVLMWTMNGNQFTDSRVIGGDLTWGVAGIGDFNGDGKSDILWRNGSNGAVLMWQMNGPNVISNSFIGGDLTWSPVAVGDFLGTGQSDILWRNGFTGGVLMWEMNGSQLLASRFIGGDTTWKPVAM